ncbi:Fic family protein, partial [Yonghaparkia sp. Soil809]
MVWTPNSPYNDLPDLPPPIDVESKRILKQVAEARAALASLDQAARRIPNPRVLLNSIPLLEAQASSEIENIVTTADELFAADQLDEDSTRPEAKEALRYRVALLDGVRRVRDRPLSATTLITICSTLQAREMRVRDLPGTFIGNPATREAIYTPPDGQRLLMERLDAWARFVHTSTALDPLVVMALAHYQFEAINPFSDGNGRTGRIVNILLLIDRGLLSEPILYLSRYIVQNKAEYYRLLLAVTAEAAWE